MEDLIYCQQDIPREQLRYGFRSSAATGCGWIATYNALHILKDHADPEELIRYYNYTGTNQISSLTQKYIDAFQYIDHKYEALFSKLSDMQKKEKTNNEL